VSQIETNIGARYSIPRPFPSTAVYSLFGSYGDVSPTWSTTKLGTLGVGWTHIRGPLQETVSLAWEESSFEAASQQGNATLVVPQVEGSWVRADDRIVTGRGQRVALTVNGAWDALLSTSTFLSTTLDAKMIRSAGRIRGIVRGTVAYLFTDSLTALPPTRRFVTGGDQSVRGYAYESLGPRNADGELIGGEALLVGSLEADYEVLPSWRVALFGDAGNALRSFSTLEVEVGVGAGIRWVSPIGMVRVDGAFAVTETGTPFRLHLVLGPDL
jgi:translocation and assembly module TamA